jgi:hypothetical protein
MNLYTGGFLLIVKIYFHNIRGTPCGPPFENNCSRGTEETTKIISQDSQCRGRRSIRASPQYRFRYLPLDRTARCFYVHILTLNIFVFLPLLTNSFYHQENIYDGNSIYLCFGG